MKRWMIFIMFPLLLIAGCSRALVQQEETEMAEMIDTKNFVFAANTANPMGGSVVRLTPGYDLVVSGDTVTATLPYYGRAYTADPNTGGIRFVSTNTSFSVTKTDNGGWDILMVPQNAAGVRELRLTVFPGGQGTLYVTSDTRQAITFNGEIRKRETGQ